jgi:hypothetical protein
MSQTIRITITPDLEKALHILRQSTLGTLNTTELIKMAVGSFAQMKSNEITPRELDTISSQLFYKWAKEDGTLEVDNIAHPEKLKPFTPKPYVRAS